MTNSENDSTLYYLSYLSSSDDNYQNQSDEYVNAEKPDPCPVYILSEREEEIMVLQSLRNRIDPNYEISETVNRAMERCTEQLNRQTEDAENRFMSINDGIERRILDASRALIESLNRIDNHLATILEDRISDDSVQFDSLTKCLDDADESINKRNQNINSFMDVMRDLETERTTLIEGCHNEHMLDVRKLSIDAYDRLYEKYLKDYSTTKLDNFRVYDELRFKLVRLGADRRRDFLLKAQGVKSKIKKNIATIFKNEFKTAAETFASERISDCRIKAIDLVNDLSELFVGLTRETEKRSINVAFVLECSDSIRTHSKKLDEYVDGTTRLHGQVSEGVQCLLEKTVGDFDRSIRESGESLSPDEHAEVSADMSAEASGVRRDTSKTISDVQSLLTEVKDAVKAIDATLGPAVEMVDRHTRRLTNARNTVLAALKKRLNTNDSQLNVFEKDFDAALNALIRASNETDVGIFEHKCATALESIRNRIRVNRENETKIVSGYDGLMKTESEVLRSEIRQILDLFPNRLEPIPGLDSVTRNECWTGSLIASFKTTVENCRNGIRKHLSTLISESKSSELLDKECAWARLLKYSIDERSNAAAELTQLRATGVNDGIAKKRLDEIGQHRDLLELHIKGARETIASLERETNELHERIDLERSAILGHVQVEQRGAKEMTAIELSALINRLGGRIRTAVTGLSGEYESHRSRVERQYEKIARSTTEFTVKTFDEGGNYGREEAANAVGALKAFGEETARKRAEIAELLERTKRGRTIEQWFFDTMKPLETERDKKTLERKSRTIDGLAGTAVRREISNLDRTVGSVRGKSLRVAEALQTRDAAESSAHWSETLSVTRTAVGYLLESYRDLMVLLRSRARDSAWNAKSGRSCVTSRTNATRATSSGRLKFHDYCKTVTHPEIAESPRFLHNVYSSVYHYISESQKNATDMALLIDSTKTSAVERSHPIRVYNEIMERVMRNSKSAILQAEVVWILKLSEFLEFLKELHVLESKFKNIVFDTYHEEFVTKLNEAFEDFRRESDSVRKRLKIVREELHYKLKPSHGHPNNFRALETLLTDFRRVRTECSDALSEVLDRTKTVFESVAGSYEKDCPLDVLKEATVSVKCISELKHRLDNQVDFTSAIGIGVDNSEYLPMAEVPGGRDQVRLAVDAIKRDLQQPEIAGTVIWPDNDRLWTNNVQTFSKLYRDRCDDVQTFYAVEKLKLVDWETGFVKDVEQVKRIYRKDFVEEIEKTKIGFRTEKSKKKINASSNSLK